MRPPRTAFATPILRRAAALLLAASFTLASTSIAQDLGPQHVRRLPLDQLYVGTCYQPVDRSREQIVSDIALMKAAGFRLVRIGDLSWDAIEPEQGRFDFSKFDFVMDELNRAGIKVLFDISGLPAPAWLHRKYPGVNLVDQHGATLHAASRYMEDISDSEYRRGVKELATAEIRHYAHHPALVAFGYDNEIGNGFMSYSEADRQRFIAWLKVRYVTLDGLNHAWSTQRWSRHLNDWEEVALPYGDGPGPPEPYLDLHRFWSDQTIAALEEIEAIRREYAPQVPTASNLWDTATQKGFDFYRSYKNYATYGAEGFYPGEPLDAIAGALLTRGDLDTPVWFNEFVTGGSGSYGGPKGIIRMWAYLGLLHYSQTTLAWTFNTHTGGEEQALFGLLDTDGTPSWKYFEFKQIATEFAKLQQLGFPRSRRPEVAIAYSFDSFIASNPPATGGNSARSYFNIPYRTQVNNAFEPFFRDNIDVALVNVAYTSLAGYKLVVVPADYVMDPASASSLRKYVAEGGTVVMTGFSAKVNEHSQWFDTPLPGSLSDVFGLRTSQFYRPAAPPELSLNGQAIKGTLSFYEVLEPHGAKTLARFTNTPELSPAVTENDYGKGHAFYLATAADSATLGPLVRSLYPQLGIEPGPSTPVGVYARTVQDRTLYVNSTDKEIVVKIGGNKASVLTGHRYSDAITLPPFGVDLLQ